MWCGGVCMDHVSPWLGIPHSYIVLPFYKWTLKRYFQGYIDACVAAPSGAAAAPLLPKEREVLLLMVQLCAALVHLRRHHVVHRDFKVCLCVLPRPCLIVYSHTSHHTMYRRTTSSSPSMAASRLLTLARYPLRSVACWRHTHTQLAAPLPCRLALTMTRLASSTTPTAQPYPLS